MCRLAPASSDLDLVALGSLGLRPGEIHARLADAGSDDARGCRFPSWRRCQGLYPCPSTSIRGNPRSGSPDRMAAASLRHSPFLKASSCSLVVSPVLDLKMFDVMLLRSAPLVLGLVGLVVFLTLFGLSTLSLYAPGTMFMPLCVHVMSCTPCCTHSSLSINEKIRNLCVFAKK